jgi:hypothetical protein
MTQSAAQNWTQPTLGLATADLHCFLIVCALVSDLYCPGYNPRQPLEKNSNLACTATRYKVDSTKIAAAVQAELSKAKNKATTQSQPANKLPTAKSPRSRQSK